MNDKTANWYRLEPADAWFFRDGRPSNRGEDQSDLESTFPPHASTVVGALRAALAREQGWNGKGNWDPNLNAILGDGFDDLGQLAFIGPLLRKDGSLIFPMPAHVLGEIQEETGKRGTASRRFQPLTWFRPSPSKILCNMGEVHLPVVSPSHMSSGKHPSTGAGFYVTAAGMTKVLHGQLPEKDDCIHQDSLYRMEPRVGIERDGATRTTGKGAMYSPRYVRLNEGVDLVVAVAGLPDGWSLPGYFPLGGESRLAACNKIEPPKLPDQATPDKAVLILATPARFDGNCWWGGGPSDDASRLNDHLSGAIDTCAFGRPIGIGGWDSCMGRPRPIEPYIAPGAVWWISVANGVATNDSNLLRIGKQTAYGYGLAFIGKQP